MKRTSRFPSMLAAMLLAVVALMTTSCADDGLLDVVPADVDFAAVVNIERLANQLDVKISATEISGPADMQAEFAGIPDNVRRMVCTLSEAIDPTCVVLFGYLSADVDGLNIYSVARVTDSEKLNGLIAQSTGSKKTSVEGFDVYDVDGLTLLSANNRLWMLPAASAQGAAKKVKKALESAKDKNITKIKEVASRLNNDKVVSLLVNLDPVVDFGSNYAYTFLDTKMAMLVSALLPQMKGNWSAVTFDISNNALITESQAFNPETGKIFDLPGLADIDTSLLELMPANTQVVVAGAITREMAKKISGSLGAFAMHDPALSKLAAALANFNGTMAFGVSGASFIPVGRGGVDEAAFGVLAALQFVDDAAAQDVCKQAATLLSGLGGFEVTDSAGVSAVKTPGATFYLFTRGNTLIASTTADLKPAKNAFVSDMAGCQLAIEQIVPGLEQLTGGASKAKLTYLATCKDGLSRVSLTFDNVRGSLLAELFATVRGMEKAIKEKTPAGLADADDAAEFDRAFDSDDFEAPELEW